MVDFRKLVTVPATKVTRREEFPEFAKRGRGVPELSAWLNAKTIRGTNITACRCLRSTRAATYARASYCSDFREVVR